MGCDIHLVTQIKHPDGTWRSFYFFRMCSRCGGSGHISRANEEWERCYWCEGIGAEQDFSTRSYSIFSVLADVRNVGDITPICRPRGLPPDFIIEPDGSHEALNRWLGDHSFSWLTLEELEAYDWESVNLHESEFVADFLGALRDLNTEPGCLRIVFGFDN